MPEEITKRIPVSFRYDALNRDFIRMMAEIAFYADKKYQEAEQYRHVRLTGDKSPINHIDEHITQYVTGKNHDHFIDSRYHLAAIAYNAMMEYYYHTVFGHVTSKLVPPIQDITDA